MFDFELRSREATGTTLPRAESQDSAVVGTKYAQGESQLGLENGRVLSRIVRKVAVEQIIPSRRP